MSIADQLGYALPPPNPLQRVLQRLAATRTGSRLVAPALRHLDAGVERVTSGHHTVSGLMTGLPALTLTTTGRRTGAARRAYLVAVPYRGALALLGTNFGRPSTPAWVLNLEARPHAEVTYRGRTVPVLARPASAEEHDGVLAAADPVYAGYVRYRERITGRRLRIFVLEPAPTA